MARNPSRWIEQGDGKLAYGMYVQNGRLMGNLKRALRNIVEKYELPLILTNQQNMVLTVRYADLSRLGRPCSELRAPRV